MVVFVIGNTYFQEFQNGDRVYFTPTERLKNGNWRGQKYEQYVGRRRGKDKVYVVFNPPIEAWRNYSAATKSD